MKLEELQSCALELPAGDRAQLVTELLYSLPPALEEEVEDDGIAEARDRSRELDEDASMGCSWEEIKLSPGR